MAKFPSQNKLWYQTGSIGTGLTAIQSGGTGGALNLPKDLSIVNRRGMASTTNKGVPLVYRCKIDYYVQDEDQNGVSAAVGSDFASTLDVFGCQNNWVLRNGAVKWHAAREAQMRAAKITRKMRGAYDRNIRFEYDSAANAWLTPIDGDGNAFTGGTWDVTEFTTGADDDFTLKIVGIGVDESTTGAATTFNVAHTYLASRATVPDDSNLETSTVPAEHSILREIILDASGSRLGDSRTDDLMDNVQDNQDNPPYDLFVPSDTNHDITEPVLLGRALASLGSGYGSCIVDIPFGLASMKASVHDAAGTSVTSSGSICVEVLDIFEMQG